jgi:hypothetical protein
MRSIAIAVLKTLAVAAVYLVVTPLLHKVLHVGASIEGAPRMPLLVLMSVLTIGLLVVAFNLVKDLLPVRGSCAKGIAFTVVFYFLLVLVPTLLGMIAFETDAEWRWLTPKKVGTYLTLLCDCVAYLAVGAVMGWLFPSRTSRRLPPTRHLALAMSVGAIVFPLMMWATMWVTAFLRPLGLRSSWWFNLTFYGPFVLTGVCLPLLHLIVRQRCAGRGRGLLATLLVFALLWLPIQNFLVAFGWSFLGPFIFSLVSLAPAALIIALTEALVGRDGSPLARQACC